MKKFLASVLVTALFLCGFPLRAEEPVRHYFNIGVHPVDPDRQIDWNTECKVELTEPSPAVRLSFFANGRHGESRPGNIRAGYVVVVDKSTGYAKWVHLCGNNVVSPADWVPVGKKECREPEGVVPTPAPEAPPLPESSEAEVSPDLVTEESPAEPAPAVSAPAAVPVSVPPPEPQVKKKGNAWKVIGGVVLGVGIGIAVCVLSKRCGFGQNGGEPPADGGGPIGDPPNGPFDPSN